MKNINTTLHMYASGKEGDAGTPWWRAAVLQVNQFNKIVDISYQWHWGRGEACREADVVTDELPELYDPVPSHWMGTLDEKRAL